MKYKKNESLRNYTTLKIGGPAGRIYEPHSEEEMAAILRESLETDTPLFVLGNGSNVLFEDEGYHGWILHVGQGWSGMELLENSRIQVKSGTTNQQLAEFARENGLTGYEFASGIPGTVGGAICMNAGAYDGETVNVLEKVRWLDRQGNVHEADAANLNLSYRHSWFTDHFGLITQAVYRLEPADPDAVAQRMQDLHERRWSKQPMDKASAGSTFKRPAGGFASALIQASGLQGMHVGDAAVSTKHAGFLINEGNATCAQFLELVEKVAHKVEVDSGIRLELEIHRAGTGK